MAESMAIEQQVRLGNHAKDAGAISQEVTRRQSYLLGRGFQQEWISSLKERVHTLYSPVVVNNHIVGLKERGFSNPQKMIESLPQILSYNLGNVDAKIKGLKDRGFVDPQKMIESSTSILGHSLENIDTKINGLKERGFSNAQKMIESMPTVLSYALENIDRKIAGLKERGFSNPQKMIESLPPILGLSLENIDSKIAGLEKRGFSNPNKMIESYPRILSYAFKSIDKRLRLIGEIVNLYKLPFTAIQLMESRNALFTSKIDKIVTLTRVFKKFVESPQGLTDNQVNFLLSSNLEDVLVAVDMVGQNQNPSLNEFNKLVREVGAAGFTKEEKQAAIEQGLKNDQKIKLRYLRGYSKKEKQV